MEYVWTGQGSTGEVWCSILKKWIYKTGRTVCKDCKKIKQRIIFENGQAIEKSGLACHALSLPSETLEKNSIDFIFTKA